MRPGLSSLLVREGVVKPDHMAAAVERQAVYAVALDTALLELDLIDEATAVRYLCQVSGYPPADREILGKASAEAAAFPRDFAESLNVAPCCIGADAIALVSAAPLDEARLAELQAQLDVPLRLYTAPEFRVREAFARVYGGPLPERHRLLVARFGAVAPAPAAAAPAPPSDESAAPVPSPAALPAPRSRAVAALSAYLEGVTRREEVLDALKRFLESRFVHGQVFVVARGVMTPAGARAPRIPLDEPSVLANVATGGIAYRGPVPRGNQALFAVLGRPAPLELIAAPVVVGGRVVCVLWGDQGQDPIGAQADELLEAVPFAERVLARLFVKRRAEAAGR